jgi:hypothetical protein
MKRKAVLIKKSLNGRKAIYIDEENKKAIYAFLEGKKSRKQKFLQIIEMILEANRPTRDLYDKENFEKGCEHITAMKLSKGSENPRIYCQQYSHKGKKVFVVIVSELLKHKPTTKLTHKEKAIIRRVAKIEY